MVSSMVDDPEHWRQRAEEVRTVAEDMHDPVTKRSMLDTAEGYERLARRAEERKAYQKNSN